jgi:hypothetical protein
MRKVPVQIVAQNEPMVFAEDEPSLFDPNWGNLEIELAVCADGSSFENRAPEGMK